MEKISDVKKDVMTILKNSGKYFLSSNTVINDIHVFGTSFFENVVASNQMKMFFSQAPAMRVFLTQYRNGAQGPTKFLLQGAGEYLALF